MSQNFKCNKRKSGLLRGSFVQLVGEQSGQLLLKEVKFACW